jgi:heptosyltransferase-2
MKIVVCCPNWIGDAVMATPSLVALRKRFPESHLALVVRPYVASVFDPAPYASELILWGPNGLTFRQAMAKLRRDKFELGILLTNSFRSALLFFLGGVRERVGYARDGRSLLLTDRLRPVKEHGIYVPTPALSTYFDLVRPLGATDYSTTMELYTTPADEAAADAVYASLGLDPRTTLIMAPGAAFGLAKCWPPDRFAAVARRARDELGLRTLVLSSPKELATSRDIVAAADGAAAVPAEPLPSLRAAKALVRRARAMVTNDSGLRHFAAAYDLPVVTIFGPTHINWTETWFAKETKLQATVECGPCQQRRCPEGHLQCMAKVTPAMVFDALAQAVAKFPYQEPRPDNIIHGR